MLIGAVVEKNLHPTDVIGLLGIFAPEIRKDAMISVHILLFKLADVSLSAFRVKRYSSLKPGQGAGAMKATMALVDGTGSRVVACFCTELLGPGDSGGRET